MAFAEFVSFIAACMALNALAIDIMLPALPLLAADFHLSDPNQAQAVVAFFLIGTGISQLFYGPLADRFGRRPILIGGLVLFAIGGVLSAFADSFATLLAARVFQGIGAGSPRVISISLARDRYSGATMAKVMSLAMMIFMAVPVLAPSLGQLLLVITPSWHWIFGSLVVASMAVLWWTLARLPETLSPDRRRPLAPAAVYSAYRQTVTHRRTLGYTIALTLVVGAHIGFISSSQQIFVDVFEARKSFPLLFALITLSMAVAAFTNSRLVHRFGMRKMSLSGLIALLIINCFHLALCSNMNTSRVSLPANLNTMAMEPMGHIAGTASSMVGFVSTVGSAVIGLIIGHLFNGSVAPLLGAYVVLALAALWTAWFTDARNLQSSDLP
ncbi:Bcr/CflA family drug resistance efflux transporter [Betaproteobacteria bacterium]|nr:Bcr/CflA family drug resistance efflux transporter [Betaproteobacteria bacterium]